MSNGKVGGDAWVCVSSMVKNVIKNVISYVINMIYKSAYCYHYRMGKGGDGATVRDREQPLKWEEIRKHCTADDCWIVLEGLVYNVSDWKKRHPGGED